jgi:cytoskeletal protein RodZ
MAPKKTKSFHSPSQPIQNKTSNKTLRTIRLPGMKPRPKPSNNGEEESQPSLWEGLRLPIKRISMVVFGLLVLALILSGLINLAKGVMSMFTKATPTETSRAVASPASSTSPSPTAKPTVKSSTDDSCTNIPARMAKAKISNKQVNAVFFQKHPDRANNPLTNQPADRPLKEEWCSIANQLMESSPTR